MQWQKAKRKRRIFMVISNVSFEWRCECKLSTLITANARRWPLAHNIISSSSHPFFFSYRYPFRITTTTHYHTTWLWLPPELFTCVLCSVHISCVCAHCRTTHAFHFSSLLVFRLPRLLHCLRFPLLSVCNSSFLFSHRDTCTVRETSLRFFFLIGLLYSFLLVVCLTLALLLLCLLFFFAVTAMLVWLFLPIVFIHSVASHSLFLLRIFVAVELNASSLYRTRTPTHAHTHIHILVTDN